MTAADLCSRSEYRSVSLLTFRGDWRSFVDGRGWERSSCWACVREMKLLLGAIQDVSVMYRKKLLNHQLERTGKRTVYIHQSR